MSDNPELLDAYQSLQEDHKALHEEKTRLQSLTTEQSPTAENINKLPKWVRDYIAGIETLSDPSGIIRENALVRDEAHALRLKIKEQAAEIERLKGVPDKRALAKLAHECGLRGVNVTFQENIDGVWLDVANAELRKFAEALAKGRESCDHADYDFEKHGRRCPCGEVMFDPGD